MRSKGTLVPDGDHATLTFRRTYGHSIDHVWDAVSFLDRLEAQLDGATMPGFVERFGELRAEYPEWSHAAAPGQ